VIGTPLTEEERARFWAKVDRAGGGDACWPWTGSRTPNGYGRLQLRSRATGAFTPTYAHRAALWVATGDEPRAFVLHSCDNPPCVNPAHLREGTARDNSRDAAARGRMVLPDLRFGTLNRSARLDPDRVRMIRILRAAGTGVTALSRAFGVSTTAVKAILSRRTWAHVA
jgi:hypothetical protein